MTKTPDSNPYGVQVGQTWQDRDWRSKSRTFVIESVSDTHAVVRSLTAAAPGAAVSDRPARIRLDRFRANSTGYLLIAGPGASPVAPASRS